MAALEDADGRPQQVIPSLSAAARAPHQITSRNDPTTRVRRSFEDSSLKQERSTCSRLRGVAAGQRSDDQAGLPSG